MKQPFEARARDRKPLDRAEVIRLTCDHLANSADPTVTGTTLIMPDGSTTYSSAENARVMNGTGKSGSRT
jgi:hypothetical protein